MSKVYLGLGGNVGDVQTVLMEALSKLNENHKVRVVQVSGLYKTPPWGDENQNWFLNACALIETGLKPIELLDFVKMLEVDFKREKTRKWGPRTLDIDLLHYEGVALNSEKLTIPHPRIGERAFVLKPLNDIAPELIIGGVKVSELLNNVDSNDIVFVGEGGAFKT